MADDFTAIGVNKDGLIISTNGNKTYRLSEKDVNDVFSDVDDVSGDAISDSLEKAVRAATGNSALEVKDSDVKLTDHSVVVSTNQGDVSLNQAQVNGLTAIFHDELNGTQEHAFTKDVEKNGHAYEGSVPQASLIQNQVSLVQSQVSGIQSHIHSQVQGLIDGISSVFNGGYGYPQANLQVAEPEVLGFK